MSKHDNGDSYAWNYDTGALPAVCQADVMANLVAPCNDCGGFLRVGRWQVHFSFNWEGENVRPDSIRQAFEMMGEHLARRYQIETGIKSHGVLTEDEKRFLYGKEVTP